KGSWWELILPPVSGPCEKEAGPLHGGGPAPSLYVSSASAFHRWSPRGHFGIASGLHIPVDLLNRRNLHAQGAPGGHPFLRPARAHRLNEQLLGRNRAVGLQR